MIHGSWFTIRSSRFTIRRERKEGGREGGKEGGRAGKMDRERDRE